MPLMMSILFSNLKLDKVSAVIVLIKLMGLSSSLSGIYGDVNLLYVDSK